MIEKFKNDGYEITSFDNIADIYIVNTCTVTNISDRKSRQMLRHVKKLNPQAIVVACGCYVQVAKDELEEIPEIDLILGNNEKKEIVKHIEQFIEETKKEKNKKTEIIQDVMKTINYINFRRYNIYRKNKSCN